MTPDPATLIEVASRMAQAYKNVTNVSLPEYTASARLSPIVLIDKRVLNADQRNLTALLQTLLSLYTGYYLVAVNLMMKVGSVNVLSVLDQFSTDRSVLNSIKNNHWFGTEGMDTSKPYLPTYSLEADKTIIEQVSDGYYSDKYETLFNDKGDAVGEKKVSSQYTPKRTVTTTTVREKDDEPHVPKPISNWDNDKAIHNITDESNLVVGKIIDVKLAAGEQLVTIPVIVQLNVKSIDPEDLITISRYNSADKSFIGRWRSWRSGEISGIKDYLLCQDLIKADRKALMADKSGSFLSVRSRETKSTIAALISGKASPNAVSTMVIISKQTATELEMAIKGSLKSTHIRNEYFASNSTMMLVVVDTRMERFTIYQRGIDHYTENTFEDIKQNAKKANGVSIEDVLKAYNRGDAANL